MLFPQPLDQEVEVPCVWLHVLVDIQAFNVSLPQAFDYTPHFD
jgi:hypothetical protein